MKRTVLKNPACQVIGALLAIAAGSLHGPRAFAQDLPLRTLAGAPATGATNGYGSNARFNHPSAVTADGAGNVYVADTENNTIRKITPNGFVNTLAGLAGSSGSTDGLTNNARFFGPQGVAADGAGQVYVADAANHTIRKISSGGAVSTFAGSPGVSNSFDGALASANFFHPESVAIGPDSNIYVADTLNHTIRKITPAGAVTTLFGLAGSAGSADGTNSRPRFNRPGGIAIDAGTNLYVADTFNHAIRRISAAGRVTTIAGMPGVWGSADGTNSNARFYLPQGIAVLASGDVLVSDSGNETLRKVSPSGTNWIVTTVAGLSGIAGNATGTGVVARLTAPTGLAVDSAGYIYAADTGNNMIRTTRVVPPTLVPLVVGNQLVVTWPTSAEGFTLQQSSAVGSTASWNTIGTGINVVGDNYVRTNATTTAGYFRLKL